MLGGSVCDRVFISIEEKTMTRWIIDWQDKSSDPDRRVLISVDNVEEVRTSIQRMLTSSTWTPDAAVGLQDPDSLPAYEAFVQEVMDLNDDREILGLWSAVTFECDDGTLLVVRER